MQTGSHWNHQTTPAIGTAIAGFMRMAMHSWTSKALASPAHHLLDWWSFSKENERADVERPVDEAYRGTPPIDVLEGRTQRYTSSPDRRVPPGPAHGASHARPNPEEPPQLPAADIVQNPGRHHNWPCHLRDGWASGDGAGTWKSAILADHGSLQWLRPPDGHLSQ